MTEKRFTQYEGDTDGKTVIDNANGKICEFVDRRYAETCCKWLNNTIDENEQLKSEIEKLSYANEDLLNEKRNWSKMSDEYAKLYQENEQLKKELEKYSNWCNSIKREDIDKVLKMSVFEIVEAFEYYDGRIKDCEKVLKGDVE